MSEEIFERNNLYVTRYCGPDGPADRRRWQFTIAGRYPDTGFMSLDADELDELIDALKISLDRDPSLSPSL